MSAKESSDDRYKEKSYIIGDLGQSIQTDNKNEVYIFDKTFSEHAEQKLIWQEAEKVIESTYITGLDTAFIAYGQTASGKTFTIQGTEKEPGIILSAITYLEQSIIGCRGDLTVTCWMGEIYMQEFRDLFRKPNDSDEPMWINDNGAISGITLLSAKNASDLKKAFDFGIQNRQVSYTDANDNSSRSHLIFQI